MRTIKLMPDYQCFPLWEASLGQVGNIDPKDLPITDDLRRELLMWANSYNETLNMDDPASSGFPSNEAEMQFKEVGDRLGERLQEELGSEFAVIIQ